MRVTAERRACKGAPISRDADGPLRLSWVREQVFVAKASHHLQEKTQGVSRGWKVHHSARFAAQGELMNVQRRQRGERVGRRTTKIHRGTAKHTKMSPGMPTPMRNLWLGTTARRGDCSAEQQVCQCHLSSPQKRDAGVLVAPVQSADAPEVRSLEAPLRHVVRQPAPVERRRWGLRVDSDAREELERARRDGRPPVEEATKCESTSG